MHIETLLAQSGCSEDPVTGAVVAPLHLSTTFVRDDDGGYSRGFSYSRDDNPTRHLFEETLARIERGKSCLSFSSGIAAANAVFQALEPGNHILLPDDVYHGVRKLANEFFAGWGLQISQVDTSDLNEVEQAVQSNTRLIWLETPSNPLLKISDIEGVVRIARRKKALVLVDGAWTTPLLQQPLALGADIVLHSVTKYLAGHSDVLGGALINRENSSFFERIRQIQKSAGAVMDPFSAWLSLRGMRSLAARLRIQCDSARHIARFLEDHPAVSVVHYPGLSDHPGHDVARRQMSDFGAMLSFELASGESAARALPTHTGVFKPATSLGGTESLIEHRASIEAPPTSTPAALLRLSVGLEHKDDLLKDLEQALDQAVDR